MNFRRIPGGVVHGLAARFNMTSWCGQLAYGADETSDPVSCRVCCVKSRAASECRSPMRPGGKDATVRGSVQVIIPQPNSESGSHTVLELTDLALEELEQANLAAYGHLIGDALTAPRMAAIKLSPPSQPVKRLIMALQDEFNPGQRTQRIRQGPLRDTVRAHEELLRLQGYLIPGIRREAWRWQSRSALIQRRTPQRCSLDGCDRPFHARGLCALHYGRSLRAGQLPPPKLGASA